MKLIVGLGNPGKKYEHSRHNFGFMLLDRLAADQGFSFENHAKFQGQLAEVRDRTHQKIFYLKPQTYMNLSGQAVGPLCQFYKLEPEDILVVFDDVDMPLGKVRFARQGRSGGHNGIRSIIETLGTQEFPRLKLGVGRPQVVQKEVSDHVLEKFSKEEFKQVTDILKTGKKAVQTYLDEGIERAMNLFN